MSKNKLLLIDRSRRDQKNYGHFDGVSWSRQREKSKKLKKWPSNLSKACLTLSNYFFFSSHIHLQYPFWVDLEPKKSRPKNNFQHLNFHCELFFCHEIGLFLFFFTNPNEATLLLLDTFILMRVPYAIGSSRETIAEGGLVGQKIHDSKVNLKSGQYGTFSIFEAKLFLAQKNHRTQW